MAVAGAAVAMAFNTWTTLLDPGRPSPFLDFERRPDWITVGGPLEKVEGGGEAHSSHR